MRISSIPSLLAAFYATAAANPAIIGTRIDTVGRLQVTASLPAGTRHAVLEVTGDLGAAGPWTRALSCAVDGRASVATFRLPRPQSSRCFARVTSGTSASVPAAEISDPDLITLRYGPAVPEQAKVTVLTSGGGKMAEWKHLPRDQYHAALIAWARAQPGVTGADLAAASGNISVHFSDGDTCVLMMKQRTSADAGKPMPVPVIGAAPEDLTLGPNAWVPGDLPGSNRAVTAFSLETTFPNSAPTISAWLGGKGYQATNYYSTTVSEVRSWSSAGSPLGALFWQAHGCLYVRADQSEGVSLITREVADPDASHPVYSEMRESGELMLAGSEGQPPYYGITRKFVRNRMKFAPHSIVMIDACFGGHPDLSKSFLDAGAGSVIGWDWLSGDQSGTPCLKVFDRLLGTNEEPPVSIPKERSFSLDAVRWWMTQNGYDYDPSPKYSDQGRPNARLVWHHHPRTPGHILMPSVMRVLAEANDDSEPFSKYLIEGDFGPDPGTANRTVLWGGQPMNVLRWDALDGIVIRMPSHPPRGEIQVVKSKDFHSYSNKVPITEWTVPFKYEITGEGSLGATMELTVKFRGDIHGSRGMPEMPPQYLGTVFSNMEDCNGSITAGGTHFPNASTSITWSGGSNLRSIDQAAAGGGVLENLIFNNGVLQVERGNTLFFVLTAGGTYTETERITYPNGGVKTTVRDAGMNLDSSVFLYQQPVTFNPATARMNAGSVSYPGAKLSWQSTTPAYAPGDTTPR